MGKIPFSNLIVFFIIFSTSILLSQSAWTWQNPLPQGNTLWYVSVVNDNIVFAVGDNQTILKSTDGGVTWDIQSLSSLWYNTFLSVDFVDENHGWAVGSRGYIGKTDDGGITWSIQITDTNINLHHVQFANSIIGWAVGSEGTILKTENGGITWNQQYFLKEAVMRGLSVIDEQNVWITVDWWAGDHLLYTHDGGVTWNQKNLGDIWGSWAIYFLDLLHGWVAFGGRIFRTLDGGQNWEIISQFSQNPLEPMSFYFKDSLNGTAVSQYSNTGGQIWKTIDGGYNWTLQVSDREMWCVDYSPTHNVGWVAGHQGTLYKTENSGQTWQKRFSGTLSTLGAIQFLNKDLGYAVGLDATVLKTVDGGDHWYSLIPGTRKHLVDCYFKNELTGIVIGVDGLILRTTDGGDSWQTIPSGVTTEFNKIRFLNDQIGFIAGEHNTVLKTTDGGLSWTSIPTNNAWDDFESVYFTDENIGWIVGFAGNVHKTTDGGRTWSTEIVGDCIWYYDVYFINHNIGFIIGVPGVIMRTEDGGATWTELPPVTDRFLYRMQFVDSQCGYISGAGGVLLRTQDSGLTWEVVPCRTSYALANLCFLNDGLTGWICGDYGIILKTTSGGFPVNIQNKLRAHKKSVKNFLLLQNYPNPFNSSTTFAFNLYNSGFVTLKIYNLLGQRVETIIEKTISAGEHQYHWNTGSIPSGIYFYELDVNKSKERKKLMIVK